MNQFYEYLHGPGYAIGWNPEKTLTISQCFPSSEDSLSNSERYLYPLAREAFEDWREVLSGRLDMDWERRFGDCPPFSDLNTQTIVHVPNWIEVETPEGIRPAYASGILDLYSGKLRDADIFFFEEEFNELARAGNPDESLNSMRVVQHPWIRREYRAVMLHELGHALGLHHKFDGTPSIMDYGDVVELQEYDISAIQALYPLVIDEGQENYVEVPATPSEDWVQDHDSRRRGPE